MRKTRFILMFAVMVLLVLCMSPGIGRAVGPPKDTIYITAQNSTGGSHPTQNTSTNAWIYAYTRSCNSTFSDNIVIDFRIENTDSASPETFSIGLLENPDATDLEAKIGGTTLIPSPPSSPTTFSVSDDNNVVTKTILVYSTGPLAPGNYQLKLVISYPSSGLQSNQDPPVSFIYVNITVEDCIEPVATCFFTDSSGSFLFDCDGATVSTNEGGTFILVNKSNGKIVATNPGQFYYNYIWPNPGDAVDVKVCLDNLVNLVPHGANAVHGYTFDTAGFEQNLSNFEMVNQDGTPCGPYGPCTINVGQGETLWVTWHLEYDGVGNYVPGAGNTCLTGSEHIGAGAILLDAVGACGQPGQNVIANECITDATGYNKK